MKKFVSSSRIVSFIFFIVLSLVLPIRSWAMENEPTGFGDIKWGADISTLPDMVLGKTKGIYKWYYIEHDKMKIGDESVGRIFYAFCKNKFCSVLINFDGLAKFNKLKGALSNIHGKPYHPDKYRDLYITLDRYRWFGKDITIEIVFNERKKTGAIRYNYMPLLSKKAEN